VTQSKQDVLPEGEEWPGADEETTFKRQNEAIKQEQLNDIIDRILKKGYRGSLAKDGGSVNLQTLSGKSVDAKTAFSDQELMDLLQQLMQTNREPATPPSAKPMNEQTLTSTIPTSGPNTVPPPPKHGTQFNSKKWDL
jgi:hypothetical protein